MKNLLFTLAGVVIMASLAAQTKTGSIKLLPPNLKRGTNVMQALQDRKSTRSFSDKELSPADLSDLLWAANGVNREDGRRTAPSARNRQDVFVYVCQADGCYLYNAKEHTLEKVSDTDARWDKMAPTYLILVANTNDAMTGVDIGVVSQNISVFCAGTGLGTVCRAAIDKNVVPQALKLGEGYRAVISHPVGYPK